MNTYIAKDWRGIHIFKGKPKLLENLSAFPPTWTGYELKCFQINYDWFKENNIKSNCVKINI